MIPDMEQHRAELESLCQRFQVQSLELFGSAARDGVQAPTSDLDFLVEFQPPLGRGYADRYFGLLEALAALFDRHVDLVVASAATNPYFREAVDKTRVMLYAA